MAIEATIVDKTIAVTVSGGGPAGPAGVGLPAGGTTGQVPTKIDGTDYNIEWSTPAGGGDMLAATYDPNSVEDDAFDMANMVEAADAKVLTADERTAIAAAGDVSKVGTPANNQVGVWTGDGTIEGDSGLTFASNTLASAGAITAPAIFGTSTVASSASISAGTTLELGHASDTTFSRTGPGDAAIEGNQIYRAGGTDVPVTDGGTGASTASGARTNLDVYSTGEADAAFQPLDADLTAIAALSTDAAGRSILTAGDPGEDRLVIWDDTLGVYTAGSNAAIATESNPATGDFAVLLGAEGDLRKVDWSNVGGGSGVDTSGTPVANDFARFTDADTIEGRSYAEVRSDLGLEIGTDVLAQQTIGIANDNLLEVDGSPNSGEYARFTANGLEGRTASEARTDLDVDQAGTDNSTDVTLAGQDYLSLSGQEITAGKIAVDDLADGTDGELITWGSDAAPATVAAGNSGDVLTSNGAGAAPTFQAQAGGGDVSASANITDNSIVRGDGGSKGVQDSSVLIDDSDNVSGIAALSTATIELGHASDTTLSRSASGVLAVEGVDVPTISSTSTLTNKGIDADNNTISNLAIGAEVTGASTDLTDTAAITYAATLASTSNGDGAALVGIEDSGTLITATTVEGALAENRTALNLNTTHRSSDGSDHTFIDQDVTSGSAPVFATTNMTEGTDKNFVTDAEATVIGNTSGTNTGDEAAASTTVAGVSEYATAAETTTGTATDRTVTPDGLAGSAFGVRLVQAQIVEGATAVGTGDGAGNWRFFVPAELNGYNLVSAHAACVTAGTTGTMDIQIHNVTDAADMLSTKITVDTTEKTSYTAAAAPVIDGTADDVATGDEIRVDVDAVHTTPANGLSIILGFQLP